MNRTNATSETPNFQPQTLDERILELNKKGYSLGQIAMEAGSKKSTVYNRLKNLRQDPDNGVVTIHKRLRPKTKGKWYKIIEILRDEIALYSKAYGIKPGFRTMAYALQDKKKIDNKDFNTLDSISVDARMGTVDSNGELLYPKLDIDCFADDSRKIFENYNNKAPCEAGKPQDQDEYIDDAIQVLMDAPNNYDFVGSRSRPGGYWYGQKEYVEAWEEKIGLFPVFERILKKKYVNIAANKGYSSLVFLNLNCERLKPKLAYFKPENIHIKYFGDRDPSGSQIDEYMKRRLKQLGIPPTAFERVAVTEQQIDDFKLPLMRINMDDPRAEQFKRMYGNKATHLDAFATKKHMKEFEKLVQESVDQHHDKKIYQNMLDQYTPKAERIDYEKVQEIKDCMYDRIREAFRDG